MKKIIISENLEKQLIKKLLQEEVTYLGDKQDIIIKWLNSHFHITEVDEDGENGMPSSKKMATKLDSKKQITDKIISLEKVFYMAQAQFKNILQDKKDRDELIWDCIKKWSKQ